MCLRAAILVAVLPIAARAQFHSDEGANFHNTTFVRVDEKARESLLEAELAEEKGDREKAAAVLRRLLLLETQTLLPQNDRVFRPARELAGLRLKALGDAALAPYVKVAEGPARAALKAAIAEHSEAALRAVVASYPLLPERRVAMEVLGDLAFESGRTQTAAFYYDRVLAEPGLDSAHAANVRAKALLCDPSAPASAPAAEARVAGKLVPLGEVSRASPPANASTLLAGNQRDGLVPHVPDALSLTQSGSLTIESGTTANPLEAFLSQLARPSTDALPPSPVIDGDRVFFAAPEALFTISLSSGQPVRPPLRYREELSLDERTRVLSGSQAICLADGVLYLSLNTESFSIGLAGKRGYLAAYDARDGRRLWVVSCQGLPGLPEDVQDLAVSGPPVVMDGRLYVSAARLRGSDTESYVLGLDARTGALAWLRLLGSAAYVPRYAERFNSMRPELVLGAPLSAQHGVLYAATNLGVIGALQADTGDILWLFKYNRINPQDPGLYLHHNFYDRGPWPPTPTMVAFGRVHVAPADSRYLYLLDLAPSPEGYLMLGDPIERDALERLVAVRETRLVFVACVGRTYRLVETDLVGTPGVETPSFKPEEDLAGYPIGSPDLLLVPTDRHLYWITLKPGALMIDRMSPERWLLPGDHPGTLAIAPPYVVSQTSTTFDIFRAP